MQNSAYRSRQAAYEALRALMLEQEMQPGDKLPSERDISLRLGFNRGTLRSAIARLIEEGALYAVQGSGTFVACPKFGRSLQDLQSLTQSVAGQGHRLDSVILSAGELPGDTALCRAFSTPDKTSFTEIVRLRSIDGDAALLEAAYIPVSFAPGLAQALQDGDSLYALLSARYGILPTRGEQRIGITYASDEESRLLDVAERQPLFWVESRTRDSQDRLFEYCRAVARPDTLYMTSVLTHRTAREDGAHG